VDQSQGCRSLGLQWRDLDFTGGRVGICRSRVQVGYTVAVAHPKTDRSNRLVSLDGATMAAFRGLVKDEQTLRGEPLSDDAFIFVDATGVPLHPDRVTNLFQKHIRALQTLRRQTCPQEGEFPRIWLHDLRHTHASLLLAAGVHPKVVSERLGHASVAMTMDVYNHTIPALQESAAALFATLVDAT
jgi:integrase